MNKLANYELFLDLQSKVKINSFFTNFFEAKEWVEKSIQDQSLFYIQNKNILLLLKKVDNFYKLYYFFSDFESFKNEFKYLVLPDQIILIELLDKRGSSKEIFDFFISCGFLKYGKIIRFNKKLNIEDNYNGNNIQFAFCEDHIRIQDLQNKYFNKYIDKHLSKSEIIDYLNNKKIIVARKNEIVVGFLIYSIIGKKAILNYILVDKDLEIRGIGSKLINDFISISKECLVAELWCREDNNYALDFYKRKGFIEDGLTDTIIYIDNEKNKIVPLLPLN